MYFCIINQTLEMFIKNIKNNLTEKIQFPREFKSLIWAIIFTIFQLLLSFFRNSFRNLINFTCV